MSAERVEGFERSVRSGVGWASLAFMASKAISFLSVLVLARMLSPSDFGLVAAVVVFIAFLELGSGLGMKATVVYEQERGYTERVQTAFTLNIALVVIFTAVGLALAPLIAEFFRQSDHVGLFRLGMLSLLLTGIGNIHDGLLLRDLDFRRRITPEVLRGVVRGVVSICLAATGFGAVSLILGMLAGSAARTIIQWRLVPFRPNLSFDRGIARTMISYGLGASLLQVITVISQNIDTAAVGRVLGGTALGLYTIGFRIPELIIANVGQFVSTVAFPALARKRVEDAAGMASASLKLLRYQALYSIPVSVGLAIVAPPLIVVLFGDKWQEAGGVMSAIAILSGIATVIYPLGDVFKALAKQRILVALNCVQIPLLIAAVILAAPSGILAVAWARVGGMALFAVLFLSQVRRVVDVGFGELLVAIRPAALTALGVGIGAGTVRIAWPALSVGPLLAATAAGAVCGTLALRWAAPAVFASLVSQLEGLRSRRVPAGARP